MRSVSLIICASLISPGCSAQSDCQISKIVSSGNLEKLKIAVQSVHKRSIVCEGKNIFSVAAASIRGYESANILLSAGISPSAANASADAPLHVAAMWADVKMVRLLVENGADPNAKDSGGATPLDLARARSDSDGLEIAKYLENQGSENQENQDL